LAECRQLKDNLRKLKHEQDSATRRLQLDRERFEQHREQEQQRILQQSEEEMKKIRKERRLMEQHLRASQAIPSRKERQEIEELRQRLASVEESLRLKEAKWQLNEERLRRRVEELHQTNGDLREEIRLLEQERISRLRPPSAVDNPPVHDGKRSPLLLKREPVASSDKMTAVVENISALSLTRKPTASKLKPPSANTLSQSSKRTALANKSASQASTLTQENRPKPAVPPKPSPTVSTIKKPPSINISSATANIQLPSVKEQTQREDGTIVTRYPNGNVKETSTNGHIVVRLYNGDVKHVFPDKSWVYYFVDTMITQTTQADGVVIFDFPDGQVEKRLPDGQVEILYPDQTVRYIFGSGEVYFNV
jgi:centromere protein J